MTNFEYILNLNIEIFADCVKNYVPSSTNDLWSLSGVIPAEHSTKYPKLFPISLSPELGFKIWLVRNSKRIETDVKSGIILLLEAMQNWNSPFWNNRSDINTWLESDYNANNDSAIWTAILTGYTDALIIPDFTLTAITSGIQVSWVNPILVDNVQYSYKTGLGEYGEPGNVTDYTTESEIINPLDSGSRYIVRLRTSRTIDGQTVYSDWTEGKSAKVL